MFMEVNHIGITSRDPEVSANFYREIFGLPQEEETERAAKVLGIGKSNIAIYGEKNDSSAPVFGSGCDFAIKVDSKSFHEIEQRLFSQRLEYGVRKSAKTLFLNFQDPDGYLVELICEEE
ncbi:glyoxalase [Leptospira neocaledonica]|uniref:Glyoxalase n=2 Tax=Leptospira neocaledonica TaxID=2023192 RepID=A0A2N0A0L5_9LEPT|nr:glyoxalase [Leptospira neocaledonica]